MAPYSPELMPIEMIFSLIKAKLKLECYKNFEELMNSINCISN